MRRRCCRRPGRVLRRRGSGPERVLRRRCGWPRPCGNGRAAAGPRLLDFRQVQQLVHGLGGGVAAAGPRLLDFRQRYGSGSDALHSGSVLAVLSPDWSVRASSPSTKPTDHQQGTRPVTPRVRPAHRDTERILPSRNPAQVDPSMSHPLSTLAVMSLWTSLRPTGGRSWAVTNECHTPSLRCQP